MLIRKARLSNFCKRNYKDEMTKAQQEVKSLQKKQFYSNIGKSVGSNTVQAVVKPVIKN